MKRKKIQSMLALVLATVMTMTACGSAEVAKESQVQESSQTVAESQVSSEVSDSQASEEPIELTIWLVENSSYEYEENKLTRHLEEKFNIDIKFQFTSPAEDPNTVYNLMLTSKEYPDLLLGLSNISAVQITAGVEAGCIRPLNEYIVDGTNYKKALDENPLWEKNLTANDGNIYSFFYTDTGIHKATEYKMYYREDWLEALGWENPPSTPEEFKEYLIAIRDNDLNGNGDPSDEIPMMGYYNGRKTDPICFLMNPFELYTENYYYITEDNEIYFSAVTDGWREGIAYIADLYAEGLIAEETYVQDQASFRAILNKPAESALIGTYPYWYGVEPIDKSVMNIFTYEALAPLAGEYQQTAATFGGDFRMVGNISTTCEHPDVAFAVMDYMLSEEGWLVGTLGVEGEDFVYSDAEDWYGNTPSVVKNTVPEVVTSRWNSTQVPKWDKEELRYSTTKTEAEENNNTTWAQIKGARKYEPYYVNHNIPKIVWAEDDVMTAVGEYSALINEYILASYTEFVMGRRDINDDKEWQNYLDMLDSMGLSEYIELLYTYYGLK